jgi:formylglycine-generating enzyme required for sulfatase activity
LMTSPRYYRRCLSAVVAVAVVGLTSLSWSAPPPAMAPFTTPAAQAHQAAWAAHLGVEIESRNRVGMTLVLIPPGEFLMGSSTEQVDRALEWIKTIPRAAPGEVDRIRREEQPQHRVVLSRPWQMGRTEVTIGQYRRFVEATNYVTEAERFGGGNSSKSDESDPRKRAARWHSPGYQVTEESPVSQITWNDMVEFCNWMSKEDRREPVYRLNDRDMWTSNLSADGYRLPTEAEWEYACRAGTTTHYSFGDDVAKLDDYAWFNRTAEQRSEIGARPVATKRPNPWGLYDMHGNVWERCEDFHDPNWYAESPAVDPRGPTAGGNRIVRGAGWHYFDLHCRSAYRNNYSPQSRTGNTGFRVVCGLKKS